MIALPVVHVVTLIPFIGSATTEDDFHEMLAFCYVVNHKCLRRMIQNVRMAIKEFFKERTRENNSLYNPHRNISLNQCVGESNTPVSEWLYVPEDD